MKATENKIAVITGAASGMGKAMAELFAANGMKLVLSDVNADGLAAVVKSITATGATALGVPGSVADENIVKQLLDTAVQQFGRLDVLVNNAGVLDDFLPVGEVTNAVWERVMSINVNGPMYATRLAVPQMLKQGGGSIINIASVGGLNGSRAGVAYTTSKHALIGMTKNVAFQYGDKGIRCNAIAPGAVNTNIGADVKQPSALGYAKLSLGMGTSIRAGEPKEIAEIALFLASGNSSLLNGAVIVADAGWTAY